jgi:hypothetical protein
MAGSSVGEVFTKWREGISSVELYPGILLMAIQRLQMALTSVVLVIFFGFVLWARLSASNRNSRILEFIEKVKI